MNNKIRSSFAILALSSAMMFAGEKQIPEPAPAPPPAPAAPQAVFVAPPETFPGSYMSGAYLGIDTGEITPERMKALALKEERGVEVLAVDRDAPAGKAGLKEHDVILEVNGTSIEGVEQLRRLIHEIPPGRVITLSYIRDGKTVSAKAQLADRSDSFKKLGKLQKHVMVTAPEPPDFPEVPGIPAMDVMIRFSSPLPGANVENLTPQLGEFFGVKNGEGILVRSVEKGSLAEQSGLHAGDVIVKVDNDRVADRGDWKLAMRHKSGKVTLGIVREKKVQSLTVNVPAKSDDESFNVLPDDFENDFENDFEFESPEIANFELSVQQRAELKNIAKVTRRESKRIQREVREQLRDLPRVMQLQFVESE